MDRRSWCSTVRAAQLVLIAALAFIACLPAARVHAADLPEPWSQRAATGWEARSVVAPGAACPVVTADGVRLPNQPRSQPGPGFPITVCAAALPDAVSTLVVAGVAVPPPPKKADRIIVIGDTGCRLKGAALQDCNDTAAWPWERVARQAAAMQPDLVIHVGDYHYRETPCPASRPGCAGSPAGDTWEVWRLDMTQPAASLMAAAPLILVRGNHEICTRGGQGWFRLFDANPYAGCVDFTPPYRVALPGLDLLIMDTALSDERGRDVPKVDVVEVYRKQMTAFLQDIPKGAWLVDHHPIWAVPQGAGVPVGARATASLQKAIAALPLENIDLVMSGHVHDFASYDFGEKRPPQLIVGNGGDALDAVSEPPGTHSVIDGMTPMATFTTTFFGFFLLERDGAGWKGTAYGLDGAILARCSVGNRHLACG